MMTSKIRKTSKMRMTTKIKMTNDHKNKDDHKNEDNLKNKDDNKNKAVHLTCWDFRHLNMNRIEVFENDWDEDNLESDDEMEDDEDMVNSNGDREDERSVNLDISVSQANKNYECAGIEVEEQEETITLEKNAELIEEEADQILDEIVEKIQLRYSPAQFQRVAINTLARLKNVVLISPTGSGKMNVPLLATLVLRERFGNHKGVCIVTQPLSSIMNEKVKNDICQAAVLSMSGELSTSSCKGEEEASLSCNLQELLDGSYPVLFGHPESFDSKLGQHILRELQRLDRLILVCIDEFHQGGQGHWDTFRPNMMKGSAGLRLYGVKNCPSLAMTATATPKEIKDVVTALGLRDPPTLLASTPIQSHIKFSMLRRPSNNYGLDGVIKKNGVRNPGTMDLLKRIYLQQYLRDLEEGRNPKKCIIFCRGNDVLGAIYCRLMELTNFKYRDCRDCPFVMNHSSLLPPTQKVLDKRAGEISLYLSSNKMLLGIDLANIDIVIFLRPYNQLAALVQGGGRGGRRQANGKRRQVQVYQLWNSQDFSSKNKLMSPDMRRICESKECTKKLLMEYFAGDCDGNSDGKGGEDHVHCCHNCDQKQQ